MERLRGGKLHFLTLLYFTGAVYTEVFVLKLLFSRHGIFSLLIHLSIKSVHDGDIRLNAVEFNKMRERERVQGKLCKRMASCTEVTDPGS